MNNMLMGQKRPRLPGSIAPLMTNTVATTAMRIYPIRPPITALGSIIYTYCSLSEQRILHYLCSIMRQIRAKFATYHIPLRSDRGRDWHTPDVGDGPGLPENPFAHRPIFLNNSYPTPPPLGNGGIEERRLVECKNQCLSLWNKIGMPGPGDCRDHVPGHVHPKPNAGEENPICRKLYMPCQSMEYSVSQKKYIDREEHGIREKACTTVTCEKIYERWHSCQKND